MQDLVLMGVVDGAGNLFQHRDRGRRVVAQLVLALGQRAAVGQSHGEIGLPVVGVEFVDRYDVPVLQLRDRAGLAEEPFLGQSRGGLPREHHLQRDHPVQIRVAGQVHDTHAAVAQHLEQLERAEANKLAPCSQRRSPARSWPSTGPM